MRFESVRIRNLYSYQDALFEFATPTRDKNVVLIHGRNGFGKTSFINSIKLLFLGSTDRELRSSVRAGGYRGENAYSEPDFMLGKGDEWEGVFNRTARELGEKECSVQLRWRERGNRSVTATRTWKIAGSGKIASELEIEANFQVDEAELQDDESRQEFLDKRLPRALLPLFVYDAEQVQRLAEANAEGTLEQIERLLDLTALTNAQNHLESVMGRLRRAGGAKEAQLKLEAAKNKLEGAHIRRQENDRLVEEKMRQIADLKRRKAELERSVRRSREMTVRVEGGRIAAEIKDRRIQMESLTFELLARLPALAPLIVAPKLLEEAGRQTRAVISASRQGLGASLESILEKLPSRLFDEPQYPPEPLSTAQAAFLKRKLAVLVRGEIEMATTGAKQEGWSIDPGRAERLDALLRNYESGQGLREAIVRDLQEATRLKREISERELQLSTISGSNEDSQRRYNEVQEAIAEADAQVDTFNQEIGQIQVDARSIAVEIEKLRTEVNALEKEAVSASRNEVGVNVALRLREGVHLLRERLREQRRDEIERAFNSSFKKLMDSHDLIARMKLDEGFRFTYLDAKGRPVGSANISAGMKQLAAQAFLWALSKVSGHHFPIVVDTPLARIDYAHQRKLITEYYPAASRQVIVLPTDSELDKAKYSLLKPWILQEFQLLNPSGESTRVVPDKAMYAL